MAVQRHKIMRQVLEVRGCPAGTEGRLSAQMRRVFYERLLPQLEQICSESSAPGELDRIDALVIDLGTVPGDGFDEVVAARFGAALRTELERSRRRSPPMSVELELFGYFVRTGTVPWWADGSDRALLETNLAALVTAAPEQLHRLLLALRDDEAVWRRIARNYRGELLDALVGAMMPAMIAAHPRLLSDLTSIIGGASSPFSRAPRAAMLVWREELVRVAVVHGETSADPSPFVQAVVRRVTRRLGMDYAALMAAIELALPAVRRTMASPEEARSIEARQTPAPVGELTAERSSPRGAALPSGIDSSFAEADQVYVENAGLVLLWPFLERLFERLDLLTERRFNGTTAAHRAAALLQYIASGVADEPLPEFVLPLNKLLCGVPMDDVFDLELPLTRAEMVECDAVLNAVIHRVAVLNGTSLSGFRGSFLLRKGQLSARDGHFLLRVERASYDILLDRVPWSVTVVKLPWMPVMIQVEW